MDSQKKKNCSLPGSFIYLFFLIYFQEKPFYLWVYLFLKLICRAHAVRTRRSTKWDPIYRDPGVRDRGRTFEIIRWSDPIDRLLNDSETGNKTRRNVYPKSRDSNPKWSWKERYVEYIHRIVHKFILILGEKSTQRMNKRIVRLDYICINPKRKIRLPKYFENVLK